MERVDDFLNDIDTPAFAKKDTSDVFIEDVDMDSDSSTNEISLLSAKIAAKTLRGQDMKKINVPFPRLCQACFSGGISDYSILICRKANLFLFNPTAPSFDSLFFQCFNGQISKAYYSHNSHTKVCIVS